MADPTPILRRGVDALIHTKVSLNQVIAPNGVGTGVLSRAIPEDPRAS